MIDFREYLLGVLALSKRSTLEIVNLACKVSTDVKKLQGVRYATKGMLY